MHPNVFNICTWFNVLKVHRKSIFYKYRKGTSIRQAPVFRHLRALQKSSWKFIIWMTWIIITLHVAGFLHPAIFKYCAPQFCQIRFESCWLHCIQSAEYWCFYFYKYSHAHYVQLILLMQTRFNKVQATTEWQKGLTMTADLGRVWRKLDRRR